MKDYYKILELPKDAAQLEIKKSYYSLAKKYHPDTTSKIELINIYESKMKLVNEAYEILSNIDKRIDYDLKLNNIQTKSNKVLKKLFSKRKVRK